MSAIISDCGKYRYRLERGNPLKPAVAFIMVNPSTADAETDDPTIRKVRGFAERAGYDHFIVGNLFAYRATDITALRATADPTGPDNDDHLDLIMRDAALHIVAWGALAKLPDKLRKRWVDVVRLADRAGCQLHCIGNNDDKHPRHPLMTSYDTPITEWAVPWFANRAPSLVSEESSVAPLSQESSKP
jgi:hypothetical protein